MSASAQKVEQYPLPDFNTLEHEELPESMIVDAGGIYFRSIILLKGKAVSQHSHDHEHATFIGSGLVRGWKDGVWCGDKGPGDAFDVPAGTAHCYLALETALVACTHDVASAMSVKEKGL